MKHTSIVCPSRNFPFCSLKNHLRLYWASERERGRFKSLDKQQSIRGIHMYKNELEGKIRRRKIQTKFNLRKFPIESQGVSEWARLHSGNSQGGKATKFACDAAGKLFSFSNFFLRFERTKKGEKEEEKELCVCEFSLVFEHFTRGVFNSMDYEME